MGTYVKTYSINLSFYPHFSGGEDSLITTAIKAITSPPAGTWCDRRTTQHQLEKTHTREGLRAHSYPWRCFLQIFVLSQYVHTGRIQET